MSVEASAALPEPGAILEAPGVSAELRIAGSVRYDDGAIEYFVTGDADVASVERNATTQRIRYNVPADQVRRTADTVEYLGARFVSSSAHMRTVLDSTGRAPIPATPGAKVEIHVFRRADDAYGRGKSLQRVQCGKTVRWFMASASTRAQAQAEGAVAIAPGSAAPRPIAAALSRPGGTALLTYLWLAGGLVYAQFARGAAADAWATVMWYTMLFEYAMSFATLFALGGRQRVGERASRTQALQKSAIPVMVVLAAFLLPILAEMWKAAPLSALGYVVLTLTRLWAITGASRDERILISWRAPMPVVVFVLLIMPFFFTGPWSDKTVFLLGATYFGLLAAFELFLLSTPMETLRRWSNDRPMHF